MEPQTGHDAGWCGVSKTGPRDGGENCGIKENLKEKYILLSFHLFIPCHFLNHYLQNEYYYMVKICLF